MSTPGPRQALQQRVAAAILQGAAEIFALQGEQASMSDVAAAAGVARATVYRYFPSREALLDALAEAALGAIEARLATARIEEVAPEEGLDRVVRAWVELGNSFVLLARERSRSDPERFERVITAPLRRLVERGRADGEIRDDITTARLADALIGLVVGVLTSTPPLGRDDMTATITSLFLDGARARGPRRR
jgi:TetR/AcrR family transcriptional regulator, mexCD-oprJ operon repressor